MELSLRFEDNNTGHHDLVLRFGGKFYVCDSYYLALDNALLPEHEGADKVRVVLRRLLEQWLSAVQNVQDGGTVYLPHDFSDQYTGWLCCVRSGSMASICRGWATIEGWAISPSAIGQYLTLLPEFRRDGPAIELPVEELVKALHNMTLETPLHFIFPADPLNPRVPDALFAEHKEALAHAGFTASLVPDAVLFGSDRLRGVPAGATVVYRGWMLNGEQYTHLTEALAAEDATPLTSPTEYLAAHHLPNWYPLISEYTPETRIYPVSADLVRELTELGWNAFFVKDYVKSLKTAGGSLITEPAQIERVVSEMQKFRGEIEGGICVRLVEDFVAETERRYFVVNGRAFASAEEEGIPDVVRICAERIPSPFFSVDVVRRQDGALRVVEIGDGQVSDLVGWSPAGFARIWS